MATDKRVVITGVGPVSAIGIGREAFFNGLKNCRCGIKKISLFETDKYRAKLAAEIADFDVEDYLESQKTYLDRSSELALAAMSLAIEDADLDIKKLDSAGTGLLLGSGFGSLDTMGLFFDGFLEKGPRLVKPFLFPHTYANTAISLVAIEYNLDGFHVNFSSGSVSASCAILEGYDLIRQGRTKMIFVGGYESLSEILFAGYSLLGSISPQDDTLEACAPFDLHRNGFVLGEGSGILVLEELERASARNAHIYGEIIGAGTASDSSINNDGKNNEAGIIETMELAVKDLPFEKRDLDYVSAAANGSRIPDRNEARAIGVFLADDVPDVPVSSVKSMTGETIGAGGVLQMIAALATIDTGYIPPTVNLETPEHGLNLNFVLESGLEKDVRRVMMNSIDPGGSIVSFVVQKME